MKLPSWLLPIIVIGFVAIRVFVGIRMGAADRKRTGKSWFQSVPIWIKGFWVLIAVAVVVLFFWAPKTPGSNSPNQLPHPTSAAVTPPPRAEGSPSPPPDN